MTKIMSYAVAIGVVVLLSSQVEAKPPIIVTDNDCATFPDGIGSAVQTGDKITLETDLTIDSDGSDCIVIANVDRVKILINGHTIDVGGGDYGIRAQNSRRIDIRGPGKIQGFEIGLGFTVGSVHNAATQLVITAHSVGIELHNSSDIRIESNIVFDNGQGIRLSGGASNNLIGSNEVFDNGTFGIGLCTAVANNTIENNNSSSNSVGIVSYRSAGNGNVIMDNIALGNSSADILHLTGEEAPFPECQGPQPQVSDIIIENNLCELGDPADLCPATIPDFDIDHF